MEFSLYLHKEADLCVIHEVPFFDLHSPRKDQETVDLLSSEASDDKFNKKQALKKDNTDPNKGMANHPIQSTSLCLWKK